MPVTYADEEREPLETEWTWQGRLPRGAVVLVAGWRQSAKGLLAWNVTAAVTNGAALPGETGPKEPGDVIMIAAEDDANEDMAWRGRAAGANLARVHDMTELDDGGPFELSASATVPGNTGDLLAFIRKLRRSCMCGFEGRDGAELAAHLDEHAGGDAHQARNPRLVIMDPLNALVMHGSIRTDQGARRVIGRLQRVAKLTGVTIMVIHHFVKSGSIGGSQGLQDAPRWVYEIRPDPAAPEYKVFHLYKCNVAVAEDLRYRIISDGHNSRIEWVDRDGMQREEQSWRGEDDLAARRQARKGGDAGSPLPPAPPVSAPVSYSAWMVRVGQAPQRLIAGAKPDMARAICEATPEAKALTAAGNPVRWQADGKGGWETPPGVVAWVVGAEQRTAAAV